MRYLKIKKDIDLTIKSKSEAIPTFFTDSKLSGDKANRKSTTENIFLHGIISIQWISKKQATVDLLSAEDDYKLISTAIQEILRIIRLLNNLNMSQRLYSKLYDDNQSCMQLIQSLKYTTVNGYLDIKSHGIWKKKVK